MRILAMLLCLAWAMPAEPSAKPPRPRCSRQTAGRLSPEAANSDPVLAGKLSRTGELEIDKDTQVEPGSYFTV